MRGTAHDHGRFPEATKEAIDAIRDDGLAAVLATGRILDELEHDFPRLVEHFDAVVAENG